MHTTKNMKETETRTMTDRVPESLLGLSYYAVTDKGDRPYNEDAWGHASCAARLSRSWFRMGLEVSQEGIWRPVWSLSGCAKTPRRQGAQFRTNADRLPRY